MKRTRVQIGAVAVACVALAACTGGLPRSLHQQIAAENGQLQGAKQQFAQWNAQVASELAANASLFHGVPVADQWRTRLEADSAKLKSAENDQHQLAALAKQNRADSRSRVVQLLAEERVQRRAAIDDAEAVQAEANNWSDFAHNPSSYLAKMRGEYAAIRKADLAPIQKTVAQAEQDWPAQKPALESKLSSLRDGRDKAEQQWAATAKARAAAAHGKISGPIAATLVEEDESLASEADALPRRIGHLRDEVGQLYTAWDKILADLDVEEQHGHRVFREKIETVTTHVDGHGVQGAGANKGDTTSTTSWVEVPEAQFQKVQNDLGMAIAHKDAGKFDSEEQTTPEPAGFAYIAPPSQGSNQYGHWVHNGGESFWAFFPQYLLLRELMWGHSYRPIVIGEYDRYRTFESAGHTYYGRETPTSPPKYGSHGTFTERHYANSRYMKSGGFASSRYGAHGPRGSFARQGRGFGVGSSRGRRFGGFSRGRSFGRGFGRSLGRGFGRR